MGRGLRGEKSITWHKTADDTWTSNGQRDSGGGTPYVGVIVYTPAVGVGDEHELTITPGPTVTQHDTLKQAKNGFRKFLFDKPPAV